MTDLGNNEVNEHFESNAFSVSWYLKYFKFLHGTIFLSKFSSINNRGDKSHFANRIDLIV